MATDPKYLKNQIRSELSELTDKRLISQINACLIDPIQVFRDWDYGEQAQQYPCWTVFEHIVSGAGVIYCEYGFGPEFPWGLSSITDNGTSMGMDSQWFKSFLAAYLDGFAPTYLDIWRVFRTTNGENPVAITSEAGWDDTWVQVMRMRELEPNFKYDCNCDAAVELNVSQRNRNEILS